MNYYTQENWTALHTAKTDGDAAINAAIDPAGVATEKATALVAMDAVPTAAETLAEAKVAALDDLATALTTYVEADYTAENWTALNTAKTDGDLTIDATTDLAGVATARNSALVAMDAVPTIADTLAAAKVTALGDVATVLATYLEANYTAESWMALNTAKTDGDLAINAATDLAGVATAKDLTLAALDAVPTFAETLAADKAAALDDLTVALATYLEENHYTAENWLALKNARTDGNTAITASTDPADVATALAAALAAMDAVPIFAETLMITDISRTSEGDVTLVLRTIRYHPLTLETSTDLKNWIPIATPTPATDSWTFVHGAKLATGTSRFYRAFLNP